MISDDFEKIRTNHMANHVTFFGVVEDNVDPMTLARVKVRCFNFHPEDTTLVPTEALPWAMVLQPTNSSSMGGVGDFTVLQRGTWVFGFFADGYEAQYPIVTHSVPGIHRPEPSGSIGGTSAGYLDNGDYAAGDTADTANRPYHHENVENTDGNSEPSMSQPGNTVEQGEGSLTAVGDINMMLQPKDAGRFRELGLTIYTADAAPKGYACKDGQKSMKFHYGTALAFEKLTKEYGKGPMYITSAYRTPSYNARVGGAKASNHMSGRALDIAKSTIGSSQSAIAAFAKLAVKNGFTGFGLYNSFLHIDTGNARVWNGAKAGWFLSAIRSAGWHEGKKGLSGIQTSAGNPADPNATPEETPTTTPSEARNTPVSISNDPSKAQVKQYITDRMRAEGHSDVAIAAALAHAQEESGFRVNVGQPSAANGGGRQTYGGYGLFQWDDRRPALFDYAGTNTPNAEQQMNFFFHEMNGTEGKANRMLRAAKTPEEANLAMKQFERYDDTSKGRGVETRQRLDLTRQYYSQMEGRSGSPAPPKGFVDPTNSMPSPEYRGEPSTNQNARGFNTQSNQNRIISRDAGRMTGVPAAGDVGTFGEPELTASPQYPYNSVRSTATGHLIELDDSPGSERVNIEHRTGSGMEIFADGHTVYRSKGNSFDMNEGDSYLAVGGKYFATSINDMNIRTTADLTQQADGSVNIIVGNDNSVLISGDYSISVGEDIKLKAGGRIVIEGNSIDILSQSTINMEAKAAFNIKAETFNVETTGNSSVKAGGTIGMQSGGTTGIKSGGAMNLDSGGNMGVKAPTVFVDDVVRMAQGGAESVADVEGNAGADTADVGSPPARKIVEKDNLNRTTNSGRVVTTEETAEHYSRNRI